MPFPFADFGFKAGELATPCGVEVHGQDRGIMREMLEDGPLGREQFFEHGFTVMLGTAPEDVMVGAGDDLNRVELDIAELLDNAENVGPARRRGRQALRMQPQATCILVAYAQRRCQLEPHLAHGQVAHDLFRAAANGQNFHFAVSAFYDIAAQIACAAKDLHGFGYDIFEHFCGVEF